MTNSGELTSAENGGSQTVGYGYNADGDLTGVTYPLPSTATWATTDTVNYGYDNADELTSVTDFNGQQISVGNTADGLPYSVGLGSSGDTITTTYDSTDHPSAISLKNSSSTLQSFTYSDAPAARSCPRPTPHRPRTHQPTTPTTPRAASPRIPRAPGQPRTTASTPHPT
jgi:YD repeat-containing protein